MPLAFSLSNTLVFARKLHLQIDAFLGGLGLISSKHTYNRQKQQNTTLGSFPFGLLLIEDSCVAQTKGRSPFLFLGGGGGIFWKSSVSEYVRREDICRFRNQPIRKLRFRNQKGRFSNYDSETKAVRFRNQMVRFRNQMSRFRNQVGRFRNQTRRFSNYDSETKTADSETKPDDGCNGVEGRRSVGWGGGGGEPWPK